MVMDELPPNRGHTGPVDDLPAIEANPDHEQISRQYTLFLLRDIHRRQRRLPQNQRLASQTAKSGTETLLQRSQSCGLDERIQSEDGSRSGSEPPIDGESSSAEVSRSEPGQTTSPGSSTMSIDEAVLPSTETPDHPEASRSHTIPRTILDAISGAPAQDPGLSQSDDTTSGGSPMDAEANPDPRPRTIPAADDLDLIEVDENLNMDEGFCDHAGAEPESDVTAHLRFLARQRPWGHTRIRRSNDAAAGAYSLTHNPPRMRRTKRKQKMRQRVNAPRAETA